jgi:Type II secretion system (T2SS), protein M subtype b
MKLPSLSVRERRTVMLGTLAVAPFLLYFWAARPYMNALGGARDQLEIERSALARERTAVADAQRNPKLQHTADSAMRAVGPRLFEGRDDVMASAELASYLGEIANRDRVWLQDAATRPATKPTNGVRTFRVEIRGESDLFGLLVFLRSIERGQKLVRVERLDVSRSARSDAQDVETLGIAATLVGFGLDELPAAGAGGAGRVVAGQPSRGEQP